MAQEDRTKKKRAPAVKPFWADNFRALLDEKEKTIPQVAEHFGLTPAAVGHWLNGHRKILLEQFLEMCRFCELDPVTVLYGAGYVPQELRERIEGLAHDVIAASPASKPGYRKAVAKLKR